MSNTFTATVPHCLIQKKPWLAYHAAIHVEEGWRTACGETFGQGILHGFMELERIIQDKPELICKRCDRVGGSVIG